MWRALVLSVSICAAPSVWAVDKNLNQPGPTGANLCEQFLAADLSGVFVATSLGDFRSSLIELRALGNTGTYTIATVRLNLPAEGFRELQLEPTAQGWQADNEKARVNIVSLERHGDDLVFRFIDVNKPDDTVFRGYPITGRHALRGDVLRPDGFELRTEDGKSVNVRFSRLHLDRAFDTAISHSLKSLLATRLHDEDPGKGDYVLAVEMKRPMTTAEACQMLGTEAACAFDAEETADQRFYKFAVAKNVYELLELVGRWTRHWEVAGIDVIPTRVLNQSLVGRLLDRRRASQQSRQEAIRPSPTAFDEKALLSSIRSAIETPNLKPAQPSTSTRVPSAAGLPPNRPEGAALPTPPSDQRPPAPAPQPRKPGTPEDKSS